jgi:hypothetical protein
MSAIDITQPPYQTAVISSTIRTNFAAAATELDALDGRVGALESSLDALTARVTALENAQSTLVLEYSFNLTTAAPPASGQIRMDQADQTAATTLWIHDTTATSVDGALYIGLLRVGSAVILQDKDDSTKVQFYDVTGPPTDSGGYTTVPVTWSRGGSPLPAQRTLLTLIR